MGRACGGRYGGAVVPASSPDALDSLDARIRSALVAEGRVTHALAYGSRTQPDAGGGPQADRWSDLEYWALVREGEALDPFALLGAVTPVALAVVNPFGTPNVVMPDLTRVELHVVPADRLAEVGTWPNAGGVPERMLVKDEDGRLRALLTRWAASPPFAQTLPPPQVEYDGVLGSLVFGSAVLARGEEVRAWEQMFWVRTGLLRLARTAHGAPQPPAASRWAERDLPGPWLQALGTTARGDAEAYLEAVRLATALAHALSLDPRAPVLSALRERLGLLHGAGESP